MADAGAILVSRRCFFIVLRHFLLVLFIVAVGVTPPTRALDIDLVSGDWQPINFFIENFRNQALGENGQVESDIISRDLTASGYFRVYRLDAEAAGDVNKDRLADIRQRGGEYFLTGAITVSADNERVLKFSLHDALTGESLGSYMARYNADNLRLSMHNISNWIYEKITGNIGAFHTKVAYVLRHESGKNELKIADYDGYNRFSVLSSENLIISPTWSPDGNALIYVSFEQNKPVVYSQSLLTGARDIVANFKGSNSAPAMSPDRQQIAVALTEHGGPQQIYLISGNTKQRLRESDGIDTEPSFSPSGNHLVFTSDDAGSPQLYEYDFQKNNARRLTYGSRYNVSPSYSPDGESIVFIRRGKNGDNIALMDLAGGEVVDLTNVRLADSPSFAPNSNIVAFKDERKQRYLATVSINGKVIVIWDLPEEGEIVDPVWSPIRAEWF